MHVSFCACRWGGNRQWENPRFFGKVKGVESRFFTRREKTLRSHGRPKSNITVPDAFSVSGRRCRRGRWRSGRDEDLSHVIHFVQESPDEFSLDDCQVPCLKSLLPWSRKQFGSVLPQLASWLVSVRQKLESATVKHPLPPTDWARPADLARVWQRFATKWAIRAPMSVSPWLCEKRLCLSVRAREETNTRPTHSTSRYAEFAIGRQPRTRFAFRENPARERKTAEHRGNAGLWLTPGTTAPRHLKRRVRVST